MDTALRFASTKLHRLYPLFLGNLSLITLLGRPERTVDYRLSRLRTNGVVDRTRPYAASGSAPYFWWLPRKGPTWWKAPLRTPRPLGEAAHCPPDCAAILDICTPLSK